MKNIHSLTKTVEKWRQVCSAKDRQKPSNETSRAKADDDRISLEDRWVGLRSLKFFYQAIAPESKIKHPPVYSRRRKERSPLSLVLAVVCLTSVIGTRFYNQPKLAVGTPAPSTIIAPNTARFPDLKTTEEIRTAAQRGLIPILKIDVEQTKQIHRNLERYLDEGDRLRQIAGVFPFAPTQILSESSQLYLRTARPWEWLTLLAEVKQKPPSQLSTNASPSSQIQERGDRVPIVVRWALRDRLLNKLGTQAVAELKAYRDRSNSESFNYLIDTII